MRCSNPQFVPNKSRFFDISTRHPLLVFANCGKCANCQQNKAAEWYYRALKQFDECVSNNGYVQFVTLSYSEQYVPRLSYYDEFSCLTKNEDMYCFMSEDLVQFHSNLRSLLKRCGFGSRCYSYFIASEFGHDNLYRDNKGRLRRGTSRPHYHALFYVRGDIDPLVFSRAIQDSWFYGLCDTLGPDVNNKSPEYVLNNTFRSRSIGGRKVVNYVSKYVQKSMEYTDKISHRVRKVLNRVSNGDPLFFKTEPGRILKRRLLNLSRQFHRQSLNFGSSALNGLDFEELYSRGYFIERGDDGNLRRYPIAQYYHRKICYDKVWHDGSYMWCVKQSALKLLELRKKALFDSLVNTYTIKLKNIGSQISPVEFTDYLVNYKGRNRAPFDVPVQLGDIIDNANRFVYNTVQCPIVSSKYLGNLSGRVSGVDFDTQVETLSHFIETNTFTENDSPLWRGFDAVLDRIRLYDKAIDFSDELTCIKQRIRNIYKELPLFNT